MCAWHGTVRINVCYRLRGDCAGGGALRGCIAAAWGGPTRHAEGGQADIYSTGPAGGTGGRAVGVFAIVLGRPCDAPFACLRRGNANEPRLDLP